MKEWEIQKYHKYNEDSENYQSLILYDIKIIYPKKKS